MPDKPASIPQSYWDKILPRAQAVANPEFVFMLNPDDPPGRKLQVGEVRPVRGAVGRGDLFSVFHRPRVEAVGGKKSRRLLASLPSTPLREFWTTRGFLNGGPTLPRSLHLNDLADCC